MRRNGYTVEELQEIFKKSNCKYLETERKTTKQSIRFICICGNETSTILSTFLFKGCLCNIKECIQNRRTLASNKKYKADSFVQSDSYKNKQDIYKQKMITELTNKYGDEFMKDKLDYSYMKLVYEKAKISNKEKYGVEHVFSVPECQEKIMETVKEKYGVTNVSHNPEILEKIKQNLSASNMEKYGVPYLLMDDNHREKALQAIKDKYGVDNIMELPETQIKIKNTMQLRFNVDNAMHLPQFIDKSINTAKRYKLYKFPSGKEIKIQGYENYALDKIIKLYDEDNIITEKSEMPEIYYTFGKGSYKKYYPDIYIKSVNKIFEIKSDYTYYKDFHLNDCKRKAVEALAYTFELLIFDRRGKLINKNDINEVF